MQLHVIPPGFGLRNTGPFGLKVEMALVHLGLEHELVPVVDPRSAPKGKSLPPMRWSRGLMSGSDSENPTGSPSISAINTTPRPSSGRTSSPRCWNSAWVIGTAAQFFSQAPL